MVGAVARAVLACVRLSSSVASPSPLVAAVRLALAASDWLAAVAQCTAAILARKHTTRSRPLRGRGVIIRMRAIDGHDPTLARVLG